MILAGAVVQEKKKNEGRSSAEQPAIRRANSNVTHILLIITRQRNSYQMDDRILG